MSEKQQSQVIVSVVIPIYNQEKYVRQCLESIKNQKNPQLQIIMVNDGSTDSSAKICEEFLQDDRFQYIYQENAGVSVARNKGLEMVVGDWVAFVDPDDYVPEGYFERLLQLIDKEDIDIVSCCCTGFDEEKEEADLFFREDFEASNDKEKEKLFMQLLCSSYGQPNHVFTAIGVPWGKLYRTSFLNQEGLRFNPIIRRMQDNIFNMYAFQRARKIKYVNEPLYYYRLDHISQFGKKYNPYAFEYKREIRKERYEFFYGGNYWNNDKLRELYYNEGVLDFCEVVAGQILHKESNCTWKQKREFIRKLSNDEYFGKIMHHALLKNIEGSKRKLLYLLVRFRWYNMIVFLYFLKNKLK